MAYVSKWDKQSLTTADNTQEQTDDPVLVAPPPELPSPSVESPLALAALFTSLQQNQALTQ